MEYLQIIQPINNNNLYLQNIIFLIDYWLFISFKFTFEHHLLCVSKNDLLDLVAFASSGHILVHASKSLVFTDEIKDCVGRTIRWYSHSSFCAAIHEPITCALASVMVASSMLLTVSLFFTVCSGDFLTIEAITIFKSSSNRTLLSPKVLASQAVVVNATMVRYHVCSITKSRAVHLIHPWLNVGISVD